MNLRPEEVKSAAVKRVLTFLNTVKTAEEIADTIEFPGVRDVGIKVAQNIIARRTQLGGFKDLTQVAAVSYVGPERFTQIVNALAATEEAKTSYVIEGQVQGIKKIDFGKAKLAVHAFIGGVEVAKANVDAQGKYELTFEHKEQPSATELRVLPAKLSHRSSRTLALSKTISPSRYVMKRQSAMVFRARQDLLVPLEYVRLWETVTKTYRMHGVVYATTFSDTAPISVEPIPATRIEFYEVDVLIMWPEASQTEAYLGYAYTAPDGSYDFEFNFSYSTRPWIICHPLDTVPDIRARISQFADGLWEQVYEGPVDWDIVDDFHRDYFVPVEDMRPVPPGGVKPEEGFRFTSVGLLPIDTTRIQQGYATADPEDPVPTISHQPFCGRLRIFGLFAEAPLVATYKVQVADADENGPIGSWLDVTDPLHNRKWISDEESDEERWEAMVLGPDPAAGRYQNIDTQPEADWHEHALKVTWNTANYANGYYALRIIGYDAGDTEVGSFEMPVVRIDNSVPETSLEVIGGVGGVTVCGALQLGVGRGIEFEVTAHDPEGHVLKYWLSGTRGREASSAGPYISEMRDPGDIWTGVKNKPVIFTVASPTLDCPSLAYNFELHVYGLATDGYNVTPGSQRARKETNLIVSEP